VALYLKVSVRRPWRCVLARSPWAAPLHRLGNGWELKGRGEARSPRWIATADQTANLEGAPGYDAFGSTDQSAPSPRSNDLLGRRAVLGGSRGHQMWPRSSRPARRLGPGPHDREPVLCDSATAYHASRLYNHVGWPAKGLQPAPASAWMDVGTYGKHGQRGTWSGDRRALPTGSGTGAMETQGKAVWRGQRLQLRLRRRLCLRQLGRSGQPRLQELWAQRGGASPPGSPASERWESAATAESLAGARVAGGRTYRELIEARRETPAWSSQRGGDGLLLRQLLRCWTVLQWPELVHGDLCPPTLLRRDRMGCPSSGPSV